MRIKLSQLRRIIKEEAARFITEGSAYDTFVSDVLMAKSSGEDYRSLPSAQNVLRAWENEQVSAEELAALLSDAGISEDEAVNIVDVVLGPGSFDDDNEDMSELVPSECPDCGAPLEGGEDGSAGCNECGWTEDAARSMDYL